MTLLAKGKQGTKKIRARKSESLTPTEHEAFKMWVDDRKINPTKLDAAEKVVVSRNSLVGLYKGGSGKPENIKRIKRLIKSKLAEIEAKAA